MSIAVPRPARPRTETPPRRPGWRRFTQHRLAVGGAAFLALLAGAALFAPQLAPYNPVTMALAQPYQAPSGAHWLGTDTLGRDVWSRILYGGRFNLGLGVAAVGSATTGGVLLGLLAGYGGRAADAVLMRIVDVLLAVPDLLLALSLVAFIGPSLGSVLLILAFSRMPRYARLVRGSVRALRRQEFVTAAAVLGAPPPRILLRHLLPNLTGVIIVYSTLDLGGVIGALAGLSFIGVGMQPPSAEWGLMLADARQNLVLAPWTAIFPGLAITLSVVAMNVAGDGLRDVLDPRMRRRGTGNPSAA